MNKSVIIGVIVFCLAGASLANQNNRPAVVGNSQDRPIEEDKPNGKNGNPPSTTIVGGSGFGFGGGSSATSLVNASPTILSLVDNRTPSFQRIENVPSVDGPPLTSSNDTCMGSISGSVNFAGFGAGAGRTIIDENCVMLKNSRELWNMGMRSAALARMCMDNKNREALEMTGFVCPQTIRDRARVVTAPVSTTVE